MLPTYYKYLYYQSVIDMYTRGNVVACAPKEIPRTSTGLLLDGAHEGKKSLKPGMSQDTIFNMEFGVEGMASASLNSHRHKAQSQRCHWSLNKLFPIIVR